MTTLLLASNWQGSLATLDGTTLVLSAWDATLVPSSAPAALADLSGEITTGDAPAYARATFLAEWDTVDQRLRVAAADEWPILDMLGGTVATFVVSTDGATDADRDVITMVGLDAPTAGIDGFVYQASYGLTEPIDIGPVDTRLDALEARTVAGVAFTSGNVPLSTLRTTLGVVDPGSDSTWGADSGATAYVDRGRVWLDGLVGTTGGSGAVGTLPSGKRPAATVYLPCTFANDVAGTAAYEGGALSITSAGVVTLTSTATLTGTLSILLGGLSFKVAA